MALIRKAWRGDYATTAEEAVCEVVQDAGYDRHSSEAADYEVRAATKMLGRLIQTLLNRGALSEGGVITIVGDHEIKTAGDQ